MTKFLKYFFLSLLVGKMGLSFQAFASDRKGEPKISASILKDSTANSFQCHHSGFSTEMLQQDYQKKRNESLADGGIMLHEEFASHHYAIKVKKNDRVNYVGSAFKGNQLMEVTMEHDKEDDALWSKTMKRMAEHIGMTPSEMESDGMR